MTGHRTGPRADRTTGASAGADGRDGGVTAVRVRLFAGARAAAGTPHADVPVKPGDRVADVLGRLSVERPALARVVPACSFLLDGVAARGHDPVGTATELDVLPPFSGG